jgi:hypothetical protein
MLPIASDHLAGGLRESDQNVERPITYVNDLPFLE